MAVKASQLMYAHVPRQRLPQIKPPSSQGIISSVHGTILVTFLKQVVVAENAVSRGAWLENEAHA
eukprot:scaffold134895_cov44-Attheya_sp.AAC.1